jgi:catechol 2,3-dioxygenase-like lactoylglutathione lyase family enzyme
MFSHIVPGSGDLDRSLAFYTAVLAPLGVAMTYDNREEGWLAFHNRSIANDPLRGEAPTFWLCRPINGAPASAGNGETIAFDAPDRAAVRAAHAAAIQMGGVCLGPPGPRPGYHAAYFAAYVRDPDGYKLCVVCHRPES